METNDKTLTAEESIALIQQMINKTKSSMRDNSFYFLLWGWLSVIASTGNFIVLKFGLNPYFHFFWFIIPVVGMPVSIWHGYKNPFVKTHIGDFISGIWSGIGIACFVIIALIFINGRQDLPIIQMFLLIMGIGVFVTGRIIKDIPLIIGSVIFWLGAMACSLFKSESAQLLIYSFSFTVGYIIPGYITKYKNRKSHV